MRIHRTTDDMPDNAHHALLRVFHGGDTPSARAASARQLPAASRGAIHRRLLDGSYAAPQVIDEVARRLLDSGEL
jgi:hypothetical protein